MASVDVNGVSLEVVESGGGDPLVLVHGSWDERHVWDLVEPRFAEAHRVVAYDRRGHGASEDGPEPGTRRDDEDDLAGLIEALDLAPADVAANSFGASIALGCAVRRPELFRALCVHEPPLVALAPDDPEVAEVGTATARVVELIERGEAEAASREFVERIALGPGAWDALPPSERVSMAAHAQTFAGEQRDPGWADIDLDALPALGFPVLFTCGEGSPPFFSTVTGRLAEAIGDAEVRTLAGAGHIPHVTHPDAYVSEVEDFLRR